MTASEGASNVELLSSRLTTELQKLLAGVPTGSKFGVAPTEKLCAVLELLVPALLRKRYPQWSDESVDGLFVASAHRTDENAVRCAGLCILISDQTLTPFVIEWTYDALCTANARYRVRVGEPGRGRLGISGPRVHSADVRALQSTMLRRLDEIEWAYEVSGVIAAAG